MAKQTSPAQRQPEERLLIALPANALESMGVPLASQLGSGPTGLEGTSAFEAGVGRNSPFPCFKKSAWDKQVIIKFTASRSGVRAG